MSTTCFNTSNALVQITMVLKMQKLKSTQLPTLQYENLECFLNECLWKDGAPCSLHEATDQILSVNANDIVRYLSHKAIVDGANAGLEDFSDILGGK